MQKSMSAYGRDMEISPKHSREISLAIRGMQVEKARKFLQEVTDLKRAVPYKRYNKEVPHRKGMAAGRFPKKAAGQILKLLESAKANALKAGKSEDALFIELIFASRGRHRRMYGAARAMGRKGRCRGRTTNLKITLGEKAGAKKAEPEKKVQKPEPKPVEKKEVPKAEKEEPAEEKKDVDKEQEKVKKWLKNRGEGE